MSYKVVKAFTDLKDNDHVYNVGDSFPHKDAKVDDARIKELSTKANKRGEILIVKEPNKEETKKKEAVVEEPVVEAEEVKEPEVKTEEKKTAKKKDKKEE